MEILSDDQKVQNQAILNLFEYCLPKVQFLLRSSGLTEELAKDIVQEGITICYHNVKSESFKGQSSLTTYTFSICKRIWLTKLREESKIKWTELAPQHDLDADMEAQEILNTELFINIFQKLKSDCQRILRNFYFDEKSMSEISISFGLGSAQAASNKKARCMKKLIEIIKHYKLNHKDFFE